MGLGNRGVCAVDWMACECPQVHADMEVFALSSCTIHSKQPTLQHPFGSSLSLKYDTLYPELKWHFVLDGP